MASICCLNNYPLKMMVARAGSGESPGQHMWGIDRLARRHDLLLAPYHLEAERHPLARLSEWSGYRAGALDQELWAITRRSDLIYAADQYSLRGLALLKPAMRKPLVSIIHHPLPNNGTITRAALNHDRLGCLSPRLADELADLGMPRGKLNTIPWGPDLRSPIYEGRADEGIIVSTGKSNRDLSTLLRALAITRQRARIYDIDEQVRGSVQNVELVRAGGPGRDPHARRAYVASAVLSDVRRAGVVAIPITDPGRMTGLTEINDALAFGKPIIITRSPYMPVDVETIGCGICVGVGDVEAWASALSRLSDSTVREEMGRNARRYAEREWNYELFSDHLERVLESIL